MKKYIVSLLATSLFLSAAHAGNWFGPGPFANGTYYPGYLNGKYMGVVTGNNISGVLGFAIVDGAPPFRVTDEQQAQGDIDPAVTINQSITPDVLQNYFAIFVEGRTYTGLTTAGIDIESNRVAGALQGQNPVGLLAVDATDAFAGEGQNATVDALSVVNRGLSGGFNATINEKSATFTFSGNGELSTPANNQTIILNAVPREPDPLVQTDIPVGTVTNEIISGRIITETTPFNLSGLRTSFSANNPASILDQQEFQQGGGN